MGAFEDFFTGTVAGGFRDFGNLVSSGFGSGINLAVSGSTTVGAAILGGAVVTLKEASGGFAYVVDFAKATPAQAAQWSSTAAGDVRDFSITAYEEAKKVAPKILEFILDALLAAPPQLGPYDATARLVMASLFSNSAVSSWERDAVAKGYTMAFDLRCSATCTPLAAAAFAGIYVDNTGQWGFFAHAGAGGTVALTPNISLNIDLWMVFGGRDKYASKCFMPGAVFNIPLPNGGALSIGGNALISQGGDFIGFRATTGFQLIASNKPVAPDTGPSDSSLVSTTLAKRAPSYDAALRTARNPGSEAAVLAAATRAALPFVTKPGAFYYIQNRATGKFLDVPGASTGDVDIVQLAWTGGANQRFRFDDAGDNSFFIVPQHAQNKALDVRGGSHDEGARILPYARHGGDNQKWQVMLAKDGWYYLFARHSGRTLDVAGGSTADNTAILQYGWHGAPNQQFRFIEAIDQDKWRWCKKCSHLFHNGTKPNVCSAGGAHDDSGSGAYLLSIAPVGYDGALPQDHWRWCKRCAVVSYGGGVGKCPVDGGAHDTALTSNYVVRIAGTPAPYNAQDKWRWCTRCQGLVYGGVPGVCAVGGAHAHGTTNYALRVG